MAMTRQTKTQKSRQRGFTLIELMISLAVLGVIVGIAMPSMRAIILNQRVRSVAFDLASSMLYARSEAGKRDTTVNVAQAAAGWQDGWVTSVDGGGPVVAQRDGFADISVTANYATIGYLPNGRVAAAAGAPSPLFTVSTTDTNFLFDITPRCVGITLSGKVTNQC